MKARIAQNTISKKTYERLTHEANNWSNATRDTEQALWLADHYWDDIFSAKAKRSAFDEVLLR
ncbi:hypothetical protein ABIF90_000820 [Bradyrhizobium japonicum]